MESRNRSRHSRRATNLPERHPAGTTACATLPPPPAAPPASPPQRIDPNAYPAARRAGMRIQPPFFPQSQRITLDRTRARLAQATTSSAEADVLDEAPTEA